MSARLDRRLHAWRPDRADARLKGRVEADIFFEGEVKTVARPVVPLLRTPGGAVDTELLYGEAVRVFEDREGMAWVQAENDGYVGYCASDSLMAPTAPTHRVRALSTFVYREPDLKTEVVCHLPHLARVRLSDEAETRGTRYGLIDGLGWIFLGHVEALDADEPDFVSVAERYLRVPYLWAGRSAFGLDCSGLVQNAMMAAGLSCLRDSDMQEASIGSEIEGGVEANLRRGDLVFWKGHVGIMTDPETVLHANGNTMDVTAEPLRQAVERIDRLYARPTSVRRPNALSAQ